MIHLFDTGEDANYLLSHWIHCGAGSWERACSQGESHAVPYTRTEYTFYRNHRGYSTQKLRQIYKYQLFIGAFNRSEIVRHSKVAA